jgi:hypothetical protein
MSETYFYTVEIPHQSPAEVTEWTSKQDALDFFQDAIWAAAPSSTGVLECTDAEICDWLARDLHAFCAFESLHDLRRWAIRHDEDGGHQRVTVLAQVESLCAIEPLFQENE